MRQRTRRRRVALKQVALGPRSDAVFRQGHVTKGRLAVIGRRARTEGLSGALQWQKWWGGPSFLRWNNIRLTKLIEEKKRLTLKSHNFWLDVKLNFEIISFPHKCCCKLWLLGLGGGLLDLVCSHAPIHIHYVPISWEFHEGRLPPPSPHQHFASPVSRLRWQARTPTSSPCLGVRVCEKTRFDPAQYVCLCSISWPKKKKTYSKKKPVFLIIFFFYISRSKGRRCICYLGPQEGLTWFNPSICLSCCNYENKRWASTNTGLNLRYRVTIDKTKSDIE